MAVVLNSDQEQFVKNKLQDGQYRDANAVIAEALRLLEARDLHYQEWLAVVRQKASTATAELVQGQGVESEVVIERLKARARQARGRQS